MDELNTVQLELTPDEEHPRYTIVESLSLVPVHHWSGDPDTPGVTTLFKPFCTQVR